MKSLEEQVAAMLAIPGAEDQMDHWRMKARVVGKYNVIFDGRVCQELEGADRLPFFWHDLDHLPNIELWIGLTLGVDWSVYTMASYSTAGLTIAYRFSYLWSQISALHTSGHMSFSIINLPPHLQSVSYDCDNITETYMVLPRYCMSNLTFTGILPGPKEPNPDEVQWFLRILVNKLICLWKDGIIVTTLKFPLGQLVRLALVALICDKPAAHKLGGFGAHSHHFFCTHCWVEQSLKATPKSFAKNGMYLTYCY